MTAPPTSRYQGKVKFFNTQKGYGFIIPNEPLELSNPEVFVHHTAILSGGFRSLAESEDVEFDVFRGPKGLQASNVTGLGGSPVRGDPKVNSRGAVAVPRSPYFFPSGQIVYNSPHIPFVYAASPPNTFVTSQGLMSPASSPSFAGSPPMISSPSPMLPPAMMGPSSPTQVIAPGIPISGGIPMYLSRGMGGFAQFALPGPVRAESPAGPQSPFLQPTEPPHYMLQLQPRVQPMSPPPTQPLAHQPPSPLQGYQQLPAGYPGYGGPRSLRYSRQGTHGVPNAGSYDLQSSSLASGYPGYTSPSSSRAIGVVVGLPPSGPNVSAEEHSGRSELDLRFEQLAITSPQDTETEEQGAGVNGRVSARRDELPNEEIVKDE
ncbi:CSD-domain-containing protein [Gonapodya prolifera JEL478]|uniref:CSD-domain-containing protein n=1 Tax=Gonapodya prolifera (strain JEL478) TaxID=1344416 RepID=A0A139A3L1_GONPJ|nr:CSD-domain-containing protein [Gonapodya prolifera JEL478]|eukprot:KXS11065.1 CSD-domain-containing protein [Gonapodya prolifera JEL478]